MPNLITLVEHQDWRLDQWDDRTTHRKVRGLIKRERHELPDYKYWVRVPVEQWNLYQARRAMEGLEEDPGPALRYMWFHSITHWKRLGVTNRELVGTAVWG